MVTYNANAGVSQGTKSDQDLWAGMQQHLNDPAALKQYLDANGLSRMRTSQVLAANGHDPSEIQAYMDQHQGFDPWGGNYGPNWTGKDMSARAAGGSGAAPQTAQPAERSNQGLPANPLLPQAQAQAPAATAMGATASPAPSSSLVGSALNWGAQPQPYQVAAPYPDKSGLQQTQQTMPSLDFRNPGTGTIPNQAQQGGQAPGMGYAQNPYTAMQAGFMSQNVGDMLTRSALPAINAGAGMAGQVGGSRQGVAQGMAIGEATKGLAQGLGNLYATNYGQDQSFGLQGDRLNLDVYNANQGWMRQGQQDQIGLMNNMLNWQNAGLNAANMQQNTPLNYAQQFGQMANQAGGQGATQTQQLNGNPLLGAIGGYQLGSKIYGG